MPNGTEEDVDENRTTGGGEGTTGTEPSTGTEPDRTEGTDEPSRPPEGFADEGTTVGAWDWRSPSGYWRISGILLAAIAVTGFVVNAIGGNYAYVPDVEAMENILVFDWAHNVLHTVLAAIALVFGFTGLRTSGASKPTAGVIGVVYLLLGIAGFFGGFVTLLEDFTTLHLEIGENILHLFLGAWGAYVGFVSEAEY